MESQIKPCFVYLVRIAATVPNKTSNKVVVKQPELKKRLQCPVCPKTCSRPSELETHLRRHTGERPFGCEVCNQKFKSQSEVRNHLRVHSDERPYSCLWCEKCFKTNGSLMEHLRTHTKEKPFFCGKCPATFSSQVGFIQHKNVKHGFGKGKKCEFCDKIFYLASGLKVHLRVHTSEKPFSCLVCGRSFSRKSTLNVHSQIHSGSKPFSCQKCPRQFETSSNLKNHVLCVHSIILPYKCEVCGKRFGRKYMRDIHINSHLNEKHYRCQLCGKRFMSSANLHYHQKAYHDNIKSFKCSKCSRSVVNRPQMKVHFLNIHSSPTERPFQCLFCTKRFAKQHLLQTHMRSHLNEKPYFCNVCYFSFKCKLSLKNHIFRVHTLPPN